MVRFQSARFTHPTTLHLVRHVPLGIRKGGRVNSRIGRQCPENALLLRPSMAQDLERRALVKEQEGWSLQSVHSLGPERICCKDVARGSAGAGGSKERLASQPWVVSMSGAEALRRHCLGQGLGVLQGRCLERAPCFAAPGGARVCCRSFAKALSRPGARGVAGAGGS